METTVTDNTADIGVVGLAVMGENLILNMESKGFHVACYNRTTSKVDDFMNDRAKGKNITGYYELAAAADCPTTDGFVGVLGAQALGEPDGLLKIPLGLEGAAAACHIPAVVQGERSHRQGVGIARIELGRPFEQDRDFADHLQEPRLIDAQQHRAARAHCSPG